MSRNGALGKRKRLFPSISSSPSLLSGDSINPLSHPPRTLRQFAAAGLAETEPLPSAAVPDFPHRPLPRDRDPVDVSDGAAAADDEGYEEDDDDGNNDIDDGDDEMDAAAKRQQADDKRARGLQRERRLHERGVGPVAAIVRRSLAEGDIGRAKAAFARLARAVVHGKKVDLRHYGYWAMGAEILMRDGEQRPGDDGGEEGGAGGGGGGGEDEAAAGDRGTSRRWGSAANIVKVKAYFEDLIHLHPYNRFRPGFMSALHFWPAMLSCEIYNIYIEHRLGLEWLDKGLEDLNEPLDYLDINDENNAAAWNLHSERLRDAKNQLRLQSLEGMRDIASRMDSVMENAPYSTSIEMLRLRAMAALYMGDLATAPQPRTAEEESEGEAKREAEVTRAVKMLEKLLARGGAMEPWFHHLIAPERKRETTPVPLYSSLPIRTP